MGGAAGEDEEGYGLGSGPTLGNVFRGIGGLTALYEDSDARPGELAAAGNGGPGTDDDAAVGEEPAVEVEGDGAVSPPLAATRLRLPLRPPAWLLTLRRR